MRREQGQVLHSNIFLTLIALQPTARTLAAAELGVRQQM